MPLALWEQIKLDQEDKAQTITQLKEAVIDLQAEKEDARTALATAKSENSTLHKRLEQNEVKLELKEVLMTRLQHNLDLARRALETSKKRIQDLESTETQFRKLDIEKGKLHKGLHDATREITDLKADRNRLRQSLNDLKAATAAVAVAAQSRANPNSRPGILGPEESTEGSRSHMAENFHGFLHQVKDMTSEALQKLNTVNLEDDDLTSARPSTISNKAAFNVPRGGSKGPRLQIPRKPPSKVELQHEELRTDYHRFLKKVQDLTKEALKELDTVDLTLDLETIRLPILNHHQENSSHQANSIKRSSSSSTNLPIKQSPESNPQNPNRVPKRPHSPALSTQSRHSLTAGIHSLQSRRKELETSLQELKQQLLEARRDMHRATVMHGDTSDLTFAQSRFQTVETQTAEKRRELDAVLIQLDELELELGRRKSAKSFRAGEGERV